MFFFHLPHVMHVMLIHFAYFVWHVSRPKSLAGCLGELWEGHAARQIVSWRSSSCQTYLFFERKLPKCPELLSWSLLCLFDICCFERQIVFKTDPRLMVRCAEDRLARGGEGRRSILLTKHYGVQLRILRPDSRPSNCSMVQHFIGGVWYCGILGSEDGAFSAQFQFLLVFPMFSMLLHSLEQHSTALIATKCN